MPEQPPSDPEKSRRTRSYGSFLLFLVVLLVVLVIVGGESMKGAEELTQDQFEHALHTGRVLKLESVGSEQGTNRLTGTYRPEGETSPKEFEVQYASVEELEGEFKRLKAIGNYLQIAPQVLLQGIDSGLYEPVEARFLTSFERREAEAPPAAEDGDEAGDQPRPARLEVPDWDEELLVTVLAAARGAEAAREADVYLPERPGHVYFDVQLRHAEDLTPLLASIRDHGVDVRRLNFDLTDPKLGGTRWQKDSGLLQTFLIYYGPWILIFVVFMLFMRQMRAQGGAGGVMSFGRSRAQLYTKENHTNITFDDVAGADEAKSEVREIVEFLKNPSRFTRIGGRIPRGVLLVGPPGCGKTLLAKAIAGEAEVPFFSISGSDFVEMFVGVGASRVRDLFKQARDNSPCIIFLDEIDAVGRRRGSGMGGGHDEREQTLNAILVEMDGFGTDEGIIVVAATNRPDVLDPALLRPGRFDREVTIDLPDLEGRKRILEVHLKRVKAGSDVDAQTLARSTPGYSGADLAAIVNEAAIMAVLDKRDEVCMNDLEEARDKVRYGRQKRSRKVEEADREITAYHEAGHAVVASILPGTDRPHKVTIVPRGRALGATMVLPDKESYHMQKGRLIAQLTMLFGGRVAEEEFCGDISAGASDDIQRATDLARAMVTELGMSDKIGPINYAERQGSDFLGTELMRSKLHSEETAREIDQEIRTFLRDAYERAREIVRDHRDAIRELSHALLRYETVTGEEVTALIRGAKADTLRPEPEPRSRGTASPTRAPSPAGGERREPDEDEGRAGGLLDPSPA